MSLEEHSTFYLYNLYDFQHVSFYGLKNVAIKFWKINEREGTIKITNTSCSENLVGFCISEFSSVNLFYNLIYRRVKTL